MPFLTLVCPFASSKQIWHSKPSSQLLRKMPDMSGFLSLFSEIDIAYLPLTPLNFYHENQDLLPLNMATLYAIFIFMILIRRNWGYIATPFILKLSPNKIGCFGVTAILSWGWLMLRLIEVEVDWSCGWLKLRLIEVEVVSSWSWLKLRLIKVEVD